MEYERKVIEAIAFSVPGSEVENIYWENGCLIVPRSIGADTVLSVLLESEGIYSLPAVLEYD